VGEPEGMSFSWICIKLFIWAICWVLPLSPNIEVKTLIEEFGLG
jgi:hypothetical protein